MTDKLQRVLDRCTCSVHLVVNEHRGYYETVETKIEDIRDLQRSWGYDDDDLLSAEMAAKMKAAGTIIDFQFYPDTPIGSYHIYDASLNDALDRALVALGLEEEPHAE